MLHLGPITVVVGRNNTGKSSLLRALYQLQQGAPWSSSDVRLGMTQMTMTIVYNNTPFKLNGGQPVPFDPGVALLTRSRNSAPSLSAHAPGGGNILALGLFSQEEPDAVILPSFSRRHWSQFEEQVRLSASRVVGHLDSNLISRLSTFSNSRTPHGKEFAALCRRVLGIELDMLTAENGQSAGIQIDRSREIRIDSMGTGITTVLSLLLNLCDNSGKLYLIEEPENDLHPAALKELLNVLVEKSKFNQFIITTHSGIVLTKLGAQEDTAVFQTSTNSELPPTTEFTRLSGRLERVEALRELGYGLADLALGEGWLIFEESTAEKLCRDYLIPWFAPTLKRLNTVAGSGASRVTSLTQNLFEMLIFADLEPAYKYRAWVLVDGDQAGADALTRLRAQFPTWPDDRFLRWGAAGLEEYYPDAFAEEVARIRKRPRGERRELKKALFDRVLAWIAEDEARAKAAFAVSAEGAIQTLRSIEVSLA